MPPDVFDRDMYRIRQDVMSPVVDVNGVDGGFLLRGYQPPFKLKSEIHYYSDPEETNEVLTLRSRKFMGRPILDLVDASGKQVIATFKAEPLVAIMGSWQILNPAGEKIGSIVESAPSVLSPGLIQGGLVPKDYSVFLSEFGLVGNFVREISLTSREVLLDFSGDEGKHLDRRTGIAAGVMLSVFFRF